jgi:protein TonB
LADFILSEIEYPKLAIEKSIEGTVTIEFIIETNGYVSNLIIKNGIGAGCSEEALRIIKQTKWQPAVINNKLVRYKTTYPITFSLRNVNKDNGTSSQSLGQ